MESIFVINIFPELTGNIKWKNSSDSKQNNEIFIISTFLNEKETYNYIYAILKDYNEWIKYSDTKTFKEELLKRAYPLFNLIENEGVLKWIFLNLKDYWVYRIHMKEWTVEYISE